MIGAVMALALAQTAATAPAAAASKTRLPEDEIIYFVLPDRFDNGDTRNDKGGLRGGPLQTGFDPAHKGFYHGGDLKGLIRRLDYIQGMGVTAIWLTPIFKNRAVQGGPGQESAGYHGYWITDFTTVDPHLGSEADFQALVDAAHRRGMKVYMDIITNHTADIIRYKGVTGEAPYRSIADYPYQRRARDGAAVNPDFAGETVQTVENFARLTDTDYAYDVEMPKGLEHAKKPDWLNNPKLYHNRGNSTFRGESSTMGDFAGLDDIMTEHPRVVAGFIDVYASWIDRFGIDGFRIDTVKHVNPEFWQAFVPAMQDRAKARGIADFRIFGEVYNAGLEPGSLALFTRRDKMPAVLDFSTQALIAALVAGKDQPTDIAQKLIEGDALYEGGWRAALKAPTFVSNHDMGRIGAMILEKNPTMSDAELLARVKLANVLLFTLRGTPVVYYGDEQGFTGHGGDQAARQDMFPTKVASYADNRLAGGNKAVANHFDAGHPLYQQLRALADARRAHAALRRGETILRQAGDKPGVLAFSRRIADQPEVLIAINSSDKPVTQRIRVDVTSASWDGVAGDCAIKPIAPGSVEVTLPPFASTICAART